jgi:3-hydroxyacyl-[acyl-carrier-protein] dehydratase
VRFVFVDRIVAVEPGRSIETLKNVSSTEDVFDDHFPGYPIFPGALVIETFEQASQLLIGITHDFARVGALASVRRAAFRHFVRPGDQLRVRCARGGDDTRWSVTATADVDGRRVASATLDFMLVDAVDESDTAVAAHKAHAERLREAVRVLRAAPPDPGRQA